MKKKILVTGGSGRFASELRKIKTKYKRSNLIFIKRFSIE